MSGITNGTSDMRDIEAGVAAGDERSITALNCYCYRVKKYIGAYTAAMNGVDLIVMTGGIGENDGGVRAGVLSDLSFLGVDFDHDANNSAQGKDQLLTKPGSKTAAMLITTNEELVIATDTLGLI